MLARHDDVEEVPVVSVASRPAAVLCSVISSSVNSRLRFGLLMRVDLIVALPFVSRYALGQVLYHINPFEVCGKELTFTAFESLFDGSFKSE